MVVHVAIVSSTRTYSACRIKTPFDVRSDARFVACSSWVAGRSQQPVSYEVFGRERLPNV